MTTPDPLLLDSTICSSTDDLAIALIRLDPDSCSSPLLRVWLRCRGDYRYSRHRLEQKSTWTSSSGGLCRVGSMKPVSEELLARGVKEGLVFKLMIANS